MHENVVSEKENMMYRLRLGVDSITFPLAKVYHFCIYLSVEVHKSVIDPFRHENL